MGFATKKDLFGKEEGLQPSAWRHGKPWPAGPNGGVLYQEKREWREGEVRTIELYYEHSILPVEFSCLSWLHTTSLSPSSSHRPSRLTVFFLNFQLVFISAVIQLLPSLMHFLSTLEWFMLDHNSSFKGKVTTKTMRSASECPSSFASLISSCGLMLF